MVKDSLLVAFNRIFRSAIAVIFVLIVSRILTKEQYGTYRQCLLIANTINLLVLFGISEVVTYYYRIYDKKAKAKLITSVILIKSFFAVISGIILIILKDFIITEMGNAKLNEYYTIIIIITVIIIFSSTTEAFYISSDKVQFMTISTVITYIIYYALATLSVIKTSDIKNVLILFMVFEFIRVSILYFYFLVIEKIRFNLNMQMIIKTIKFAVPIALSVVIVALNREVDKLLVSFFFSTEDFAVYNNATVTLPIIEFITISIGMVIFPRMVQIKKQLGLKQAMKLFRKAATLTCMILYPLMIFLLFFGENYITILFSEKYIDATSIFQIYMLRLLITFAMYSSLVILIEKKRLLIYSSSISLVFNIVLSYILLKLIGMKGAAIASLIVQLFTDGFLIFLVIRNSALKLRNILNLKVNVAVLVLSAVSAFLARSFTGLFNMGVFFEIFIAGIIMLVLMVSGLQGLRLLDFRKLRVKTDD